MNTLLDILVTATPFAAGAWAAWALPRWAGEGNRRSGDAGPLEWSDPQRLPSQPYRGLRKVA